MFDLLRQALGSLKVTPLATKTTPTRAMTEWLNNPGQRPPWLTVGNQVELKATTGDDSVVRGRQLDLNGEEVNVCLDAGRQVTRLAMTVNEQVSLILSDDLALKGLRFADVLLDEASQTDDGDDPALRLETDFALMIGALSAAISHLMEGLGGEATPAAPTAMVLIAKRPLMVAVESVKLCSQAQTRCSAFRTVLRWASSAAVLALVN